jgi:tetratricopeptide (TPR) repeat protein
MPVLRRTPHLRLAALATCVSLVCVSFEPAVARAATLTATLTAPAGESSNSEAEAMFRRGQAKYETADYNGAIDLWTEAYAVVESTPETASIKALLLYNLAQAHVKAYELDEDDIHLKQALQLLQSFRNNLSLLYEDKAQLDEETKKVDERLAELEAMLAAANPPPEDKPPPSDEPPPPELGPEPEPVIDAPGDARPGKPLIIAGGVLLGLGVGSGVVAIVGGVLSSGANDISDLDPTDLAAREQRFGTGRTGNVLAIVGSVGAGLLLPIGGALIGVGAKRNGKAKPGTALLQRSRLGASFGGAWGNGAGLTISGRF